MSHMKLIYLMDPHCGWCFGFSDTISKIRDLAIETDSIEFTVIPGGLFIPAIAGSAEFADDKRPIASRIEDLFGLTFSPDYFDNVLSVPSIDSTPSNRAVLACNLLDASRSLELSKALIDAAFVYGRNISSMDVVLEVTAEMGFDRTEFGETMASPEVEAGLAAAQRFAAETQSGFPSVFLGDTQSGELVHVGGADLTVEDFVQIFAGL